MFLVCEYSEVMLCQFIADVSYELRILLTTICGYVELVCKGVLIDKEVE